MPIIFGTCCMPSCNNRDCAFSMCSVFCYEFIYHILLCRYWLKQISNHLTVVRWLQKKKKRNTMSAQSLLPHLRCIVCSYNGDWVFYLASAVWCSTWLSSQMSLHLDCCQLLFVVLLPLCLFASVTRTIVPGLQGPRFPSSKPPRLQTPEFRLRCPSSKVQSARSKPMSTALHSPAPK